MPVEVIVNEEDGTEYTVPITDVTGEALRGIRVAAFAVAGVCWLLRLIMCVKRAKGRDRAEENVPHDDAGTAP
jgi:hypothetical protein